MPVIPGSHNLLSNQIFLQCFSQSLGQPLSFHSHLIGYQVLETLCPKYVSKCPPTSSIPVSFKPLAFLEGETNSFCTPLPVHSHFYSSFPSTLTHPYTRVASIIRLLAPHGITCFPRQPARPFMPADPLLGSASGLQSEALHLSKPQQRPEFPH